VRFALDADALATERAELLGKTEFCNSVSR
jgi:hypothetical protein